MSWMEAERSTTILYSARMWKRAWYIFNKWDSLKILQCLEIWSDQLTVSVLYVRCVLCWTSCWVPSGHLVRSKSASVCWLRSPHWAWRRCDAGAKFCGGFCVSRGTTRCVRSIIRLPSGCAMSSTARSAFCAHQPAGTPCLPPSSLSSKPPDHAS